MFYISSSITDVISSFFLGSFISKITHSLHVLNNIIFKTHTIILRSSLPHFECGGTEALRALGAWLEVLSVSRSCGCWAVSERWSKAQRYTIVTIC